LSNYYEMLKIIPSATQQEIQTVIDERYDQCRRLVTHHDPNVVNQANITLQLLEKIRETLLNKDRKSVYDEALGISGNVVGGLMDPMMNSASPTAGTQGMVPPMMGVPSRHLPTNTPVAQLDGWYCTKCNSISQIGSLFCKSCGSEIGQSCPKCGTSFEKTAQFCPSCGVRPQQYFEEQEKIRLETIEVQRQGVRQKLSEAEAQLQAGMYGLAKDSLGAFEGLGKASQKNPVICNKNDQEWKKAEALNQNSNIMRKAYIKQNTLKITIGYASAGAGLGLLIGIINLIGQISNIIKYNSAFDWSYLFSPFLTALGLGIGGAIAGAVGSGIYFYQWGGRRPGNQDLIFGAVAPIIMAIVLPFSGYCFGAILLVVIVWFGLTVFGLGGNRRG
jgi:uncharacterized Zn finger protein (UPF0148 family)